MEQDELNLYVQRLREKLDDETFTLHDVYQKLWGQDNNLSHEQREVVHQTLELPEPVPSPIEIPIEIPIFQPKLEEEVEQ